MGGREQEGGHTFRDTACRRVWVGPLTPQQSELGWAVEESLKCKDRRGLELSGQKQ